MSAYGTAFLDETGLKALWMKLRKVLPFHKEVGTDGTAGWVNFLSITCEQQMNRPLIAHLLCRGYASSTMEIMFKHENNGSMPNVQYFQHLINSFTGSHNANSNVGYTYTDADSVRTYKFWKKKNEAWGSISVHVDCQNDWTNIISFPNEHSSTEPTGIVYATEVWNTVPVQTAADPAAKKIGCNTKGQVVLGDALTASDVCAAPTSHASSATTYGVGTSANYGHVKIDNSTPLTVGTTSTDGVATGKAHKHNNLESVARADVTTADLAHSGTNTRAHLILSQITSQASTTHDPGDGYMLTFMWDNSSAFDSQLYVPNNGTAAANDFGRLKIRYRENASEWGDWGYLPAASQATTLTSSDNLNSFKGTVLGSSVSYCWTSASPPTGASEITGDGNAPTAVMQVIRTHSTYCIQIAYTASKGMFWRWANGDIWSSWTKILTGADIPGTITTSDIDDIWSSV